MYYLISFMAPLFYAISVVTESFLSVKIFKHPIVMLFFVSLTNALFMPFILFFKTSIFVRLIFSVLALMNKPAIGASLLIAIVDSRKSYYKLLWIPASLLGFFFLFDLVPFFRFYDISAANEAVTLPGWDFVLMLPHILTYLYLAGVVVYSIHTFRLHNNAEGLAVFLVFLLVCLGFVFEEVFKVESLEDNLKEIA